MLCLQIIFSWSFFFFQVGRRGTRRGSLTKIQRSSIREKKVCNIYIIFYSIMFRWMFFCFIVGKRMGVPEEEPEEELEEEEEDWEEEPGRGRRGKRRGLGRRWRGKRRRNKKRTIKQKVCLLLHHWRDVFYILLIIHLLFADGWKMQEGRCRRWQLRMRTWKGTFL